VEQSRRSVAEFNNISLNSRTNSEQLTVDVNLADLVSDIEDQAGHHRSIALGRPSFPRPFQSLKTLRCLIHSLGLGFNYSSAVPGPPLYHCAKF